MLQLKIPRLTPNMHNLVRKNNLITNLNNAASSPVTASNKSVLICKPLPTKRTEQHEPCEIDLTSPVKPTQPPPRLEEFTIESPLKKKANESRMDLTVSDPNEPKVDLMKQVIRNRFQLQKSPIIPLLNPATSKGPDEESELSESEKNKKNAKRDIENTDKNESIENKREKRQKRNSFLVPQDPIQTVPAENATSSKNISTETSLNDKTPKPKKKIVITTSVGNTSRNRSLISKDMCKEMYEKRMQKESSLLTNDSLYSNVSKTSTALGSSMASNFNSVNGSTSSSSSRKRIVIMTNVNRGKTPRVDPFRDHMIKAGFGAKFADKG
jgi:hypothetical protein